MDCGYRTANKVLRVSLAWKELSFLVLKSKYFREAQSYCGRLEFKPNHMVFVFFSRNNDESLKV